MVAGCPFCGRLPVSKIRGNPAAGRTGPLKTNIPQIRYGIRLAGCFRLFSGFLFPPLHLGLDSLHLIFLGFDVCIVLVQLILGHGNLGIIGIQLLLLGIHQLLHGSLFGLGGLLKH